MTKSVLVRSSKVTLPRPGVRMESLVDSLTVRSRVRLSRPVGLLPPCELTLDCRLDAPRMKAAISAALANLTGMNSERIGANSSRR